MPLKVYHNIIILKWLFIIFILLTLIQSISSVDPRWGHTATLINDTIYFVGGRTNDNRFTLDFISLKLSKEFPLISPPWIELDSTGMPLTFDHSAVAAGINNTKIVVFGGGVDDPASAAMSSLLVYDPKLSFWVRLTISSTPSRRFLHSAVILSNQIMLIYGGEIGVETGNQNSLVLADLWGFNTSSLSGWQGFPSLANSPGMRERHTASIIGNKMIIIGGTDGKSLISMSSIYVFDSIAVNWTLITATGQVPSSRIDHSAVVLNDSIIIYGGSGMDNITIFGDVAVLNTTYWDWAAPPTTNTPMHRFKHSATIFGANMIVAFGIIRPGIGPGTMDDQIYCLNLLNWTWLNNYAPQPVPQRNITPPPQITTTIGSPTISPIFVPTNPVSDAQTISISKGLAIGLLILLLFICILMIAFLIYYINQQRKISNGSILVGIPYSRTSRSSMTPQPNNNNNNNNNNNISPSQKRRSRHSSFLSALFRFSSFNNDGDELNQTDTDEQMTQPQNSIFAQTLLGNTSDNDIRPSDPENGKRRSVKFSETNITITPVVFTKGHHPQGSLEVELGNTNDLKRISGHDIITRTGMETEDGGSRSRRLSSLRIESNLDDDDDDDDDEDDDDVDDDDDFDEDNGSINIVNIGRGLDVQMQSNAMLVSRNELRVVNPDPEDNNYN
ncbi:galactose oxidase [Gigaspora margarita]|uniref:Galactose oxidase n=1 Tax=Gigaspora margarita TaxID=4874 RepID=A0A8H3XGR9_GIGMA|nr:galactose oxidase [Gigaspora margarita]